MDWSVGIGSVVLVSWWAEVSCLWCFDDDVICVCWFDLAGFGGFVFFVVAV